MKIKQAKFQLSLGIVAISLISLFGFRAVASADGQDRSCSQSSYNQNTQQTACWLDNHIPGVINPDENNNNDAQPIVIGWETTDDQSCTNLLQYNYNHPGQYPTNRAAIDAAAYEQTTWLSKDGDSDRTKDPGIAFADVQKGIGMQINQIQFLCAILTKAASGKNIDPDHKVTQSQWPNDRDPVPDNGSDNAASLYEEHTKIISMQPSEGSVSSWQDDLSYNRNDNSRYWWAGPQDFTYTPPSGRNAWQEGTTHTVTVQVYYVALYTYHHLDNNGGEDRCSDAATGQKGNAITYNGNDFYPTAGTGSHDVGSDTSFHNSDNSKTCGYRSSSYTYKYHVNNDWTLADNSTVTLNGNNWNGKTITAGQTVKFDHSITNRGNSDENANYNWDVEGNYDGNGYDNAHTGQNDYRTPPPALPTGSPGGVNPGDSAPNPDGADNGAYNYSFPSDATPGTQYCQWIDYNHATGSADNSDTHSTPVCVTLAATPPTNDCSDVGITPDNTYDQGVPGTPEPNSTYTVKLTLNYGATAPAPSTHAVIFVTGPSGTTVQQGSPYVAGGNASNITETTSADFTAGATTGTYYVTYSTNDAPPISYTNTDCTFSVTNRPYMQAYGGDVAVGADIEKFDGTAGVCPGTGTNGTAGITSWNKGSTGSYSGSGNQFGAEALAIIEGFTSASKRSSTPQAPTGLTFANSPANSYYGGGFRSAPGCNDFDSRPVTSGSFSSGSAIATSAHSTNVYASNGNITIAGGTLGLGQHVTIYVKNGNVTITAPIRYAGYASLNDIPSLAIVAEGGNIYLSNAVTQLDGLFVAEPSTDTTKVDTGIIYTCSDGLNNGWGTTPTTLDTVNTSQVFTRCANQLVVNGSFVAKQIKLMRTFGTLQNASPADSGTSSGAAEVFNYSPEEWLGQPGDGTIKYQAITSLPPVL